MPNGNLGTVEQSLKISLQGAEEAKEQLTQVGDYYEGLIDLLDEPVNLSATEQLGTLKGVIQQAHEEMLELSEEFSNFNDTSFGEMEGLISELNTMRTAPHIQSARFTQQTSQPDYSHDEGLILFDDELDTLSNAVTGLSNEVRNLDFGEPNSVMQTEFRSDFDTGFTDMFQDMEDSFLELDDSLSDLQNTINSTSESIAYVHSNNLTGNNDFNLNDTQAVVNDTYSDDNLDQMGSFFTDVIDSINPEIMMRDQKIRDQYEAKLDYVPDEAGFSSLNTYYKELEKRYVKLESMLTNLSDVDTDLTTSMTDTRDQLSSRMNDVKATQQQEKADLSSERELLRQQAEARKLQQQQLHQQEQQALRQQQQLERTSAQSLLQLERQQQEEERRQKQEEMNMTRLHGQAIAEDLRRSQQVTNQTSSSMRSMQSNLNATVINLNQAVQLIGTTLGKVSQLTNFYDQYTNSNARLQFNNLGDLSHNELQKLVSQSASDARLAYSDVANNISRFATTGAFSSNTEVIEFAETVAKSLRVSGSDASEANSVVRQLSQSLSSGRLNGDEFRSISENSPLLMSALTKLLETDKAEVMKMSMGGTLSVDVIKDAVSLMGEEVNEAFKDMPKTFYDLRTEMTNTLGEWLTTTENGQDMMNELFDIYEEFVDFINSDDGREAFKETAQFFRNMAQAVGGFIKVATPVLGVIGEHATLLGSMYLAYQAVNVGMKVHMLATTSELITNFTSMGTAMSALSTLALGFLANPVVLATLGIGAVAYGATKLYDYVDEANEQMTASELGGLTKDDLLAQGYQSEEASMLQTLYAQRNQAYNDILYYDTGTRYKLPDSHNAKSKYISNDDEYQERVNEYEQYLNQIEESSYLTQLATKVDDIAESTSKTAENTSESNFIKDLQMELRQSQQVKTITQMTPNIVINIDGKNEDSEALGSRIASILKQELQLSATS